MFLPKLLQTLHQAQPAHLEKLCSSTLPYHLKKRSGKCIKMGGTAKKRSVSGERGWTMGGSELKK